MLNQIGLIEDVRRRFMDEFKKDILEEGGETAFFYIPDISGFTNFIKNANLQEGSKLIHDLLEIIIDSNILNLKIAEIQGDAVWFYKLGEPISLKDLERQTVKTFTDFQCALVKLEEKHELLASARDLTLKILVHFGRISTASVKGTLKLIGTDSIVAHRIMKNNIDGHEYLLMTDQYLSTQNESIKNIDTIFKWDNLKIGKTFYEYLGDINYKYISLSNLRQKIKSSI